MVTVAPGVASSFLRLCVLKPLLAVFALENVALTMLAVFGLGVDVMGPTVVPCPLHAVSVVIRTPRPKNVFFKSCPLSDSEGIDR